ncbi:MAG: hypothetical protein ACFE0J_12115 [Elainellaceae cyanobacterium]
MRSIGIPYALKSTALRHTYLIQTARRVGQTSATGLMFLGISNALSANPVLAEPISDAKDSFADLSTSSTSSASIHDSSTLTPFHPSNHSRDTSHTTPHEESSVKSSNTSPTPRLAQSIGLEESEDWMSLNALFGEDTLRISAESGAISAFPIVEQASDAESSADVEDSISEDSVESEDYANTEDFANTEDYANTEDSIESDNYAEADDYSYLAEYDAYIAEYTRADEADVDEVDVSEIDVSEIDVSEIHANQVESDDYSYLAEYDAYVAEYTRAVDYEYEYENADIEDFYLEADEYSNADDYLNADNYSYLDEYDAYVAEYSQAYTSLLRDRAESHRVETTAESDLAQAQSESSETSDELDSALRDGSDVLGSPEIQVQGIYLLQGDESSARGRVTSVYAFNPHVLVGGTVDLTTGDAFADSREEGLNLNELYVSASPPGVSNLRFVVGLLDLTSYFDRNSFAKDGATHFFNPVFQTNPALSAASIASRPVLLVNFDVTDNLILKAATFSSTRDLGDFELDGFAGEIGLRLGTAILRATYVNAEDEGENDGFREIFDFDRGDNIFGLRPGDREEAFGLNGEVFIPDLNLGLFGRVGWYENLDLGEGGQTFSLGMNLLDLFITGDRLGLGYGRLLSNTDARRDRGDNLPDVLELFYDAPITRNLRAGVTLQQRDGFSETVAGFRIRVDFDGNDIRRLF